MQSRRHLHFRLASLCYLTFLQVLVYFGPVFNCHQSAKHLSTWLPVCLTLWSRERSCFVLFPGKLEYNNLLRPYQHTTAGCPLQKRKKNAANLPISFYLSPQPHLSNRQITHLWKQKMKVHFLLLGDRSLEWQNICFASHLCRYRFLSTDFKPPIIKYLLF